MIAEQKHIKKIIEERDAFLLSSKISKSFDDFITNSYEWTYSKINWIDIQNKLSINWDGSSDTEISSFFYETTLSQHEFVAVVYGFNEQSIGCSLEFCISNLDLLFFTGWGTRFIFGIDKIDSDWNFKFEDFVEVVGASRITGFKKTIE